MIKEFCDDCGEEIEQCSCIVCEVCGLLKDDCECEKCLQCGEVIEECKCERCEGCGELIEECICSPSEDEDENECECGCNCSDEDEEDIIEISIKAGLDTSSIRRHDSFIQWNTLVEIFYGQLLSLGFDFDKSTHEKFKELINTEFKLSSVKE